VELNRANRCPSVILGGVRENRRDSPVRKGNCTERGGGEAGERGLKRGKIDWCNRSGASRSLCLIAESKNKKSLGRHFPQKNSRKEESEFLTGRRV